MQWRITAVVASLAALVAASNVVELNSKNFNDVIGKGKPALVEFFAPWCGHCKNLAPIYEQLADGYAHAKDKVLIVKVDADGEGKDIAKTHGVTGYPTLKWFTADDAKNPTPYEGARELDALAKFVTEKSGVKSKIKAPPPPATLQLDYRSFDEVVYDENKNVLVAFTAPWCGHCKNMKPQLEKVAENFKGESNCIVANVDADAAPNKGLATKFEVTGFPTIKFFASGSKDKEPVLYDGGRSEEAFTEYLNEHCGTKRKAGGGLNEEAGRIAMLDAFAKKFIESAGEARQQIYTEAASFAKTAGLEAKHYIKVMEKVANGSEEYIAKETKRLGNILAKKTLAPAKLDEIKIRANILAQFVAQKAEEVEEEVADAAESVVQKAKEEL